MTLSRQKATLPSFDPGDLLDVVKKTPRPTLREWVEQNEKMMPNVQFCISPSDTIYQGVKILKHKVFHTMDGEVMVSPDRDGYLALYGHLEVYDIYSASNHTMRVYLCPPGGGNHG